MKIPWRKSRTDIIEETLTEVLEKLVDHEARLCGIEGALRKLGNDVRVLTLKVKP